MFQKIKKLYISKNKNITKKSHWKKGEQLTVTLNAASVEAIREEGEEVKAEKWQNNINDNYKTTTSIKIEETTRRQEFNYLNKGSSSISSSIGSNRERVLYQSCSCNISSNRNQDIKGERRPEVIEIFRFGQKMANTISVMTNVLRNAVSKQRIRYKEKGFNLDLAYICDNIIAMGYPADNLEKIYRNPLEDVYKFLEENHRDRYKIYNLCLERSYDVNKFHGRVSVYPFEDHNPPTIELIQRFCADVDEWLKADTNNVAAVHCKAGKGRTGTMICCYLIYSNQQQTAEDALAYYDEKRTKDRKGVTIPSQRRYVQYFAKLLRSNLHYTRRSLEFFEIRFTEAHALYSQGTVNCSISALEDSCGCFKVQTLRNLNIDFRKSFTLDMKNFALRVAGDIKIELTQKTSKKKILHFWFNTYFVYDSAMLEGEGENAKLVYTLNKWEIDDAHKDKEHKMFSDDFKVQLAFYNESNDSTDLNRPNDNHHLHRTYPATTPNLPVLRGTVPVPVTMTTTVTTKPCESSNSSNSEMQIICDEQATGIGIGGGGGTYENLLDTKPYGNHHQDTTTTTILTDRRPTSMITLNDTNSSPHKLIQQQHHRRSVTNTTTTTTTSGNHQRQLLQIQHKINTCSSNNHQQQQQQQHNNHIQMGKTTTMRNINNQSNMSNSSNSSINSHITSVSSSASMASTSGGIISGGKQQQQQQQLFINDFNEKHEDELDNEDDIDDDDEDEDNDVDDDDDDEEDDADREDNEEDWESGESAVNKPLPTTTTTTITTTITTTTTTTISPIRFNEKQLVTNNRTTNSTTNYTTLSTTTTTTTIPKTTTKNSKCLNIKEKQQKQQKQQEKEEEEKQHQRQMKKNSSGSSTSSRNYFNDIGDIVHFYNDNGNKVHIDNNYIDDVDDDDDDDDDENDNDDDDDNMLNTTTAATTNNYANNNIQCAANPTTTTTTTTTTFENDDSKSAKCTNNNINNNNNNKQLMSNLVARYKFMHLLTAKASNKVMAPRHSYFKRKSLKTKSTTTTCTTEAASASIATETTKNINCLTNDCYMLAGAAGGNDCVDGVEELRTRTTSVGNSGGCAGGVGGGLAKASKLKLKLGLSKTNSKLKWTQKFHWLQNYVRSADAAADLRKSFAQTTTTTTTSSSQRLNSNSSGNATTTTTTNTTNCNGIKNSTPSQIVVGSSCTEDYYSSICDNQLSFNNSPCKSPRSQKQKHATHAATTAAAATGGSSIQSPTSLLVNDDVGLKVVVVAARPANIEAIGFNVASTTDTTTTTNISSMAGATAAVALGTCNITNGSGSNSSSGYATASTLHSDSSIYSTPPTSVLEQQTTIVGVVEHTHHHEKISPFIFPNISAEITELAHVLKSSNIDTKTTETTTTTFTTTTIKNGSIKHNIDNDNDDEFDEHNNKQA